MSKLLLLLPFFTFALYAEDSDAVIVPLRDASRPPLVHVHSMNGVIRVRGEDRKDIAVDGSGNVYVVRVPRHSSLELKSLAGGEISVENVEGDIEVEDLNGAIHLHDVSGSVLAHSLNGEVVADLRSVDPSKPMSFSTMNGKIDVTLPTDVHANVTMKTDNGEILSDFEVKLDSRAKSSDSDGGRQADGTFHVRLDKTLHGTINGGGPEYKFRSFNGEILIRKRK